MTQGELAMDCDKDDDQTNKLNLSWASAHAICNTALMVRVGQIWECVTQKTSLIYEIAGFHNEQIYYYPWFYKGPIATTSTVNSNLYLIQGTSEMALLPISLTIKQHFS